MTWLEQHRSEAIACGLSACLHALLVATLPAWEPQHIGSAHRILVELVSIPADASHADPGLIAVTTASRANEAASSSGIKASMPARVAVPFEPMPKTAPAPGEVGIDVATSAPHDDRADESLSTVWSADPPWDEASEERVRATALRLARAINAARLDERQRQQGQGTRLDTALD